MDEFDRVSENRKLKENESKNKIKVFVFKRAREQAGSRAFFPLLRPF